MLKISPALYIASILDARAPDLVTIIQYGFSLVRLLQKYHTVACAQLTCAYFGTRMFSISVVRTAG